jgi:hypothetical protein
VLKEFAPCVFCDAAQLATVKVATAQVVCEHVEERRLLVGRDQSGYVFELVLLLRQSTCAIIARAYGNRVASDRVEQSLLTRRSKRSIRPKNAL